MTLDEFSGVRVSRRVYGRDELEGLMKRAADIIRLRVDYKYILLLFFLKRLNDVWWEEFEAAKRRALASGYSEEEAEREAESEAYHRFKIPRKFLWSEIRKDVKKLPERLAEAFKKLAELNPELRGVVDRFSFIEFTLNPENAEVLRQLVELFSDYRLGNGNVSEGAIGDAYEWVLRHFAPQRAKEGEVLTPPSVIKLIVKILDPKPMESFYDPACGPGRILIYAYKYVREKFGKEEAGKLFLFGQEVNQDIYALCRMNMLIHGIDAQIELGDSLLYPKFKEGDRLRRFDVVAANPPWNQDGYGEATLRNAELKVRFRFGYPPNNSADWAWAQHMLASAKDDGRVGLIIDNGCLFRGGKERSIRAKIVDRDLIECIILLPEKLFYNTGAPGAIIIFNKNKPEERKGKILFINASNEYIPHPEVRRLNSLSGENIEKIVDAYRTFTDMPGFSRVVDVDEIKDNNYNLNVTLYVMPIEEEEQIDILKEFSELKQLEKERQTIDEKLEEYISQLTQTMEE